MQKTHRINLWSSPRNISTALMYAFAQRSDSQVVDEPLYAHYLTHCKERAQHPGEADILASQPHHGEKVVQDLFLGPPSAPVMIFKQMTHHLVDLDWSFLEKMQNVMLIRSPREIIASYAKVIQTPQASDIGVLKQLQLKRYLEKTRSLSAILDTNELLKDPEGVLRRLCEDYLEIPFQPEMLTWAAGPRPEDGIWATYWYNNVHRSTGFQPYQAREIKLPAPLEELAQECQPAYLELFDLAIKANKI
jgi:hypothetical protein